DLHEAAQRKEDNIKVRQTVQEEKDRDDQDDSKNKDSSAQRQLQARRQALRANGNALVKRGKGKKFEHPMVTAAKRDGFERLTAKKAAEAKKMANAKLQTPAGPRFEPAQLTERPHYLLNDVRDPGEFFEPLDEDGQNQGFGGGQGQEQEQEEEVDPEW